MLLIDVPPIVWTISLLIAMGLFIYYALGRFGKRMLIAALTRQKVGLHSSVDHDLSKDQEQRIETISSLTNKIIRTIIILIVGTIILAELGVNIGPILAGAGVIGVAVGFGAQSLVKDFLSGIFIVIEDQYAKGDVVKLGDVSGKVVNFSLRRTVLRDMDGVEHHVPNGEIARASNYTKDWSNVHLNIPVDYKSNLDQVVQVLNDVAHGLSVDPEWKVYIRTEPQTLGVSAFEDSAIVVKLHGRVDADQKWAIERELRLRIKTAFDSAGISIPYPHQVQISKKN